MTLYFGSDEVYVIGQRIGFYIFGPLKSPIPKAHKGYIARNQERISREMK